MYNYTSIQAVDIHQIHIDVAASAMTDKTIEWCRWDEDNTTLQVEFTNVLSGADKTKLDTIVTNNST